MTDKMIKELQRENARLKKENKGLKEHNERLFRKNDEMYKNLLEVVELKKKIDKNNLP